MSQILLVQTAIAGYRQRVLSLLEDYWGASFCVITGNDYFTPGIRTEIVLLNGPSVIRNYFFLRRKLLWQGGSFWPGINATYVILELNPRIVSNWLILLMRRAMRRPTILWGHAWPRRGINSPSDWIRGAMRRLASTLVCYTEQQKNEVLRRQERSVSSIFVAPNALYLAAEMHCGLRSTNVENKFIYVGRLVGEKKPELMIRAFRELLLTNPDATLEVVGDGPQRASCEALVDMWMIGGSVRFFGHVSDYEQLSSLYSTALASLSPGYAGLAVTQCLGFGVPIICADNEPHAPEIEACTQGFNCVFFPADSAPALAGAMSTIIRDRTLWIERSAEISRVCRETYSAEKMAAAITDAVEYSAKSSSSLGVN